MPSELSRRSVVGIDLGTTNTVVARAEPGEPPALFAIRQLTARGEVDEAPLLPSVLYLPHEGESVASPHDEPPFIVGEWAKRRGAEVPGRAIASAKSWLSHAAVDREAEILPWSTKGGDGGVTKLSPVSAEARLLGYVRRAYNAVFPKEPLESQQVVLTVPASFDEVARQLTVRAAMSVGLDVRLLEEPQAAFYDFLAIADRSKLLGEIERAGGELTVLVCDIGGGTTDLSLISLKKAVGDARSDIAATRVAVGSHLLLGGDNMDIALAHATESQLSGESSALEPALFEQWVAVCRGAKEALLSSAAPESVRVALAKRGSALVGATKGATIARADAASLVLDGFFPTAGLGGGKGASPRSGVVSLGLPYERDVAITRHIVRFLETHAAPRRVSALLLNGGVVKSPLIAKRLHDVVSSWSGRPVLLLEHERPDHAVALGAVAYGLSLLGTGPRIGGGASHGYYIRVEGGADGAPLGVCVLPKGATEGARHSADDRSLVLRVGRKVRFDLYVSTGARTDAVGAVVPLHSAEFERLLPLGVKLEGEMGETERPVRIEAELSAVGTLDIACVESNPPPGLAPRRSRLEFVLGSDVADGADVADEPAPTALRPETPALLERAFGKPRADATGREAKDLLRDLEHREGERGNWSLGTLRALCDALIPLAGGRRRSADHERIFFLLLGYTLRPGFGCAGDEERIASVAKLFGPGREQLAFPSEARGWTQFWIAWRRLCGGLDEATQTRMRDLLDPWLAPPGGAWKRPKKGTIGTDAEVLEIASYLERVPVERRVELGTWLLEKTWTSREPALWAAIGRVGARVPTYASAHHVVSPLVAERWLDHAMREKWNELPAAAHAAASLARVTGDRARDVSSSLRQQVAKKLASSSSDAALIQMVTEVVPMKAAERALALGDSLPIGLRLSLD